MLLGTLGVSLLSGRGLYRTGQGKGLFILPEPHPLTNFEIIGYYKNENRFSGVYPRDNLPEHSSPKTIKNG